MRDDVVSYVEEPRDVGLPDLTGSFRSRWEDYYKGIFFRDGFPGRKMDEGALAHPIYGVYIIEDYLKQAEATGEYGYVEAAHRVARAAVRRMNQLKDALVFWYEPSWGLSTWVSHRHYSALTQSYYSRFFAKTAALTGDEDLSRAAAAVYRSLLVPAEDAGVLVRPHGGIGFEEVPTRPTSLILNGWLSVLVNMWEYARVVDNDEVRDVVIESARTLLDLLPLYDVEELQNSRYSLAGYTHARVLFDKPGVHVEDVTFDVPGDGAWTLGPGVPGRDSRWTHYLFRQDLGEGVSPAGRQLRLNLVLSRLSHPEPNVLRLTTTSPVDQSCRLQLRVGRYSPLSSSPVDLEWKDIATAAVSAGGSTLTLPVPWSEVPLIGYPTNFMKKIDGEQKNVYHEIHCKRLTQLAEMTGVRELGEWARTWRGYTEQWATSDVYAEVRAANAQP